MNSIVKDLYLDMLLYGYSSPRDMIYNRRMVVILDKRKRNIITEVEETESINDAAAIWIHSETNK